MTRLKLDHTSPDGRCVMCRDGLVEARATWHTSMGRNVADVCECCLAMIWNKMIPGHMSMETFTIGPVPAHPPTTGGA